MRLLSMPWCALVQKRRRYFLPYLQVVRQLSLFGLQQGLVEALLDSLHLVRRQLG